MCHIAIYEELTRMNDVNNIVINPADVPSTNNQLFNITIS
jgi:hypothetical protein